ncbi:MAG: hypothetical protein WBC63_01485 [Candidatus Bipolaricaulia bacterium]
MLGARSSVRLAVLLGVGLALGFHASAAPTLDARIGFASTVVPRLHAPIRVTVSGLDAPRPGSLRVVQRLGILSDLPSTVTIDLTEGDVSDGIYESAIPVYDPLNPIDVHLIDPDGTIIASQQLNFRLFMRSTPYPLVCGSTLRLGGAAIPVGPSELSQEWWAYEAIDTIWLASVSLPRPTWDAIMRWVQAGGSLVLLTGSDYYKLDASVLQELFPHRDAVIEEADDGVAYLKATYPAGAETLLWRDDGIPLLHARSMGAGSIQLVTVRADDLSDAETRTLASRVRSSKLFSLQSAARSFHGEIRVPRPNYLMAPLIVLVLVAAIQASRVLVVRGRAAGEARWRIGIVLICAAVIGASVFAGFYTNRAKRLVELYHEKTTVDVYMSSGVRVASHVLFAPGFPLGVDLPRTQESVPAYALTRSVAGAVFDSTATSKSLEVPLSAGETRHLRAYGDSRKLVEVRVEGDRATIVNHTESGIAVAYVIAEGLMYRTTDVPPGEQVVPLIGGLRVWALRGIDEYAEVLKIIEASFPFTKGVWVIAVSDETTIQSGEQTEIKVRDVHVRIAQGVTL